MNNTSYSFPDGMEPNIQFYKTNTNSNHWIIYGCIENENKEPEFIEESEFMV